MWGHHPALGAPFLEPGCRISAPALGFHADDRAPGTGLAPGVLSEWPHVALQGGGTVDLSMIPPEGERRAVLGYLTGFSDGSYRVTNPRLGLELELRWPLELFPAAWFWQELHASQGYPWYRRLYTTALEPNSSWPGRGSQTCGQKEAHRCCSRHRRRGRRSWRPSFGTSLDRTSAEGGSLDSFIGFIGRSSGRDRMPGR